MENEIWRFICHVFMVSACSQDRLYEIPCFFLWHLKENIIIFMSFKNQSVDTGIIQLWTDVELCNKWQYQLPRQPKCLPHECILTGQTPTRYLQMFSSNMQASQTVERRFNFLGRLVYILWEKLYINYHSFVFSLLGFSSGIVFSNSKVFATCLWIETLACRYCCL